MWVTTVTHKEVEIFMLSLTLQAQARQDDDHAVKLTRHSKMACEGHSSFLDMQFAHAKPHQSHCR